MIRLKSQKLYPVNTVIGKNGYEDLQNLSK